MIRILKQISIHTLAARGFRLCALFSFLAGAVSAQAQTVADADIFNGSETVTVTDTFGNSAFDASHVVDGTNNAFVFQDNTPTNQTLSISGFNSSINSLRFFDTPSYSERLAVAVTVHYSAVVTTSLDTNDYTLVGAFVLPGEDVGNFPDLDVYPNPTCPADNPNPGDPAVNATAIIGYQDVIGLGIPVGTRSLLLEFTQSSGNQGLGLTEIQAFVGNPVPPCLNPPPSVDNFQAEDLYSFVGFPTIEPATVFTNGTDTFLSWGTLNATYAEIDQGVGAVPINGFTSVTLPSVANDTVFTLTATNAADNITESITVRTVEGEAVTYRYVRYTPIQLRGGLFPSVQLSELQFLNANVQLTPVSATNALGVSPGSEGPEELWDNNTGTKWLCSTNGDFGQAGTGCQLVFDFGSPTTFDGYFFATANDASERDPLRWTLEGSNDGTIWKLIELNDEGFPFVPTTRLQVSQKPVPLPGASLLSIEQFTADIPKFYPGEPVVLTWLTAGADSVSINGGPALPDSGSQTNTPVVDTEYILSAIRGVVTLTATVNVDVVTSPITNIAYANFNIASDELFLIGGADGSGNASPGGGLDPAPLVGDDPNLSPDDRLRLTYDQGGTVGTAWFGLKVGVGVGFRTTFGLNMESYGANFVGAEGISFIVQNTPAGRSAVPNGGSGQYLLSTNALSIVFDAYLNDDVGDPSAAFVRVVAGNTEELALVDITAIPALTNSLGTDPQTNLTFTGFNSNQVPYAVEVTYAPGDLDMSINGVSVLENVVVDLGAIGALDGEGKSYVGFAAQTGGDSQNNDVTSWFLNRRPALEITSYSFDFGTDQLTLTWGSSDVSTYKVTSSADLGAGFPTVLASGIPGAAGLDETSTTVSFTEGTLGFIRVEEE